MYRISRLHIEGTNRVTRFMIGSEFLLIFRHDKRATFRTHHHFVFGVFEFLHRHNALATTRSKQCCFVDEIHQISTREARRSARYDFKIHIGCERHFAHMHLQNLLAALHVRIRHNDLAIETTGPQQCRIKNIRTVRRRNQDDAFIGFKTIHLDEQLVERLFTLVIAAAKACATMSTHRIDFVDEDDARCVLLCLFKHVAHTGCADADEHFNEVRTRDCEERHIRFARNGASKQSLTRARRTHKQHAARNTTAEALEFLWITKKLNNLFEIFFRFINASDIRECHTAMCFGKHLGF